MDQSIHRLNFKQLGLETLNYLLSSNVTSPPRNCSKFFFPFRSFCPNVAGRHAASGVAPGDSLKRMLISRLVFYTQSQIVLSGSREGHKVHGS